MGPVGKLRRLIARRKGVHFSTISKKRSNLLKLSGELSLSNKFINKPKIDFYSTPVWLKLKREVIQIYGRMCMKCHTLDAEFHVDHIKPRSIYPELELDISNLQILCKTCNELKSNKNSNDYRPTDLHTWRQNQFMYR